MTDLSTENFSILVVDDDIGIRRMLSLALEDEGYDVRTAESGDLALAQLKERPTDLIISDVRMPGGDGVYLLDTIRRLNKSVPVFILMSGFTDITPEEAIERGAKRFFHKPYKLEELLTAIKDLRSEE